MTGRTAYVRRRPSRGRVKPHALRGVIYLPQQYTGKKVKIVTMERWKEFKKRLRQAETKIRKIHRIH